MFANSWKLSLSLTAALALGVSIPAVAFAQDGQVPSIEEPGADGAQTEVPDTDADTADEQEVVQNDPDEVICHTRRQTGSHFRERICMTRRQQEQTEAAANHSLERMRRGQALNPD